MKNKIFIRRPQTYGDRNTRATPPAPHHNIGFNFNSTTLAWLSVGYWQSPTGGATLGHISPRRPPTQAVPKWETMIRVSRVVWVQFAVWLCGCLQLSNWNSLGGDEMNKGWQQSLTCGFSGTFLFTSELMKSQGKFLIVLHSNADHTVTLPTDWIVILLEETLTSNCSIVFYSTLLISPIDYPPPCRTSHHLNMSPNLSQVLHPSNCMPILGLVKWPFARPYCHRQPCCQRIKSPWLEGEGKQRANLHLIKYTTLRCSRCGHRERAGGRRGHCVWGRSTRGAPSSCLTLSTAFTRLSVATIMRSGGAEPAAACLLPN